MVPAEHWDAAYATRGREGVSWYQPVPETSLELFGTLAIRRDAAVIDAGGGGSLLADALVARGFTDITVLDIAAEALAAT